MDKVDELFELMREYHERFGESYVLGIASRVGNADTDSMIEEIKKCLKRGKPKKMNYKEGCVY